MITNKTILFFVLYCSTQAFPAAPAETGKQTVSFEAKIAKIMQLLEQIRVEQTHQASEPLPADQHTAAASPMAGNKAAESTELQLSPAQRVALIDKRARYQRQINGFTICGWFPAHQIWQRVCMPLEKIEVARLRKLRQTIQEILDAKSLTAEQWTIVQSEAK